jgi:hypothetical protein
MSYFSDFSSQSVDDDPVTDLSFRHNDPRKNKRGPVSGTGGRPRIALPESSEQKEMSDRKERVEWLLAEGHRCSVDFTWTHPDLLDLEDKYSVGVADASIISSIVNNAIKNAQERHDGKVVSYAFDWKQKKERAEEERSEKAKRSRELAAFEQLKHVCNTLRCVTRVSFLVSLPEKGRLLPKTTIRDSCVLSCFTGRKKQCVNRASFLIFRQ